MKMVCHFQFKRLAGVLVLLIISTSVTKSCSKKIPGFLNIDCGNSTEYDDSDTGLTWEGDGKYTEAGMTGEVPDPIDKNLGLANRDALKSFRYFPKSPNKQCYILPLFTSNISVLIRAMFWHGNSAQLDLPIKFQVYINATAWTSIQYDAYDPLDTPIVLEGIFFSPGNVTYFCLVPVYGTPFISSLELRRLDSEGVMYSFPNSRQLLLSNIFRFFLGYGSTVRYPDDAYDRLWSNRFVCNDVYPLPATVSTSSEVNNVPLEAMAAACNGTSLTSVLSFTTPSYVCAMFYFVSFSDTNHSGDLVTNIVVNSVPMQPVNVTSQIRLRTYPHNFQVIDIVYIQIKGTVNAMELYEEIVLDTSSTYDEDARFIDFLTKTFNMTDWQGDPCTPVSYKWISCVHNRLGVPDYYDRTMYISNIALANLSNSTRLLDFGSFVDLNIYTQSGLQAMKDLSIIDSNVDDTTFQFLLQNLSWPLRSIDMTRNNITFVSSLYLESMQVLNLSQNQLHGEVPYLNLSFYFIALNLSGNSLKSFPKSWGRAAPSLQFLDLSDNHLTGDMTPLNELMQYSYGVSFIKEMHVSNNNLTGDFSSELYFSSKSVKIVNLDQNGISGVLNLATWHERLKLAANMNDTSSIGQLFSFVNNNISDISPSAEVLQPTIDKLINSTLASLFNQSGVLLGGNPYCDDTKSQIQRYLCRSSTSDVIYAIHKKKNYIPLIIGLVVGGTVLLAILCILSLSVWSLWKQVSSYREVQQEMADRKVQPPYYSYRDIKLATRNFHKDNELGKGAFGVVYKGVLQDGSFVAVKRLFGTQKLQVLNDFLNEVVLITGIKHINLVQLTGCCIGEGERILVYEYVENGNVADALWGKASEVFLDWKQRLTICLGIARGLSYLHEELHPRIIHRDIKAANVLLDKEWYPKIGDFGLAKPILDEETQAQFTLLAGTRGYSAPEYIMEGQLTEKADVFSFGILFLEIIAGRKCIDSTLPPERLYLKTWAESLKEEGKLLEVLQPELRQTCPEDEVDEVIQVINIALSCVQNDPKRRVTMSQVVVMLSGNIAIIGTEKKKIIREIYLEEFVDDDNGLKKESDFEENALLQRISENDESSTIFTPSIDTESSYSESAQSLSRRSNKRSFY